MPFQNFPYTNFQNLNLDWILKTMKEAVEQVDGAYEAAEDALEAANNVQSIANQANATAAGASAAATNAVNTANAAETKANTAMSDAASAITTATGAVATANGASSRANSAYQNSVTAMNNAIEAISRASSAENTAQQALDTVATKNTKIFMTGYGSAFADTQGNPLTRSQIISKITAGDNLYFVSSDTKEIWLLFSANTDVFSIFHISHDNNNADRLRIITIPASGTITTNSYPFSGASGVGIFLIDAERVAGQNGVYYTFDKTPSQIYDAILAGMLPVVTYSDESIPAQPIYKYYVMAFYQFDGEDAYVHFSRQDETVFETMRYIASEQKAYLISVDQKYAYVTPEMFGAVGDGVANDTTAVFAAMQNKRVILSKNYKITNTINALAEVVLGNGSAKISSSGGTSINFSNKVHISDFGVDIPVQTDGIAIMAQNDIVADNMKITGGRIGISTSESVSESAIIRNCSFENMWGDGAKAVYITHRKNVLIEHNYINNVSNNLTVDADGIVVWQDATDQTGKNARIIGNHLHNCRGRFIKGQAVNVVIEDNTMENDSDFVVIHNHIPIDIQRGDSVIRNNLIKSSSGIVIQVPDTTTKVHSVIENNEIVYVALTDSASSTPVHGGIIVKDSHTNETVTANVEIHNNRISGDANNIPIKLAYLPNAIYRVTDNEIFDVTYYALVGDGTQDTTTRFIIKDNKSNGYAYFARFNEAAMPNVDGDDTVNVTTALNFSQVLNNTKFIANTTAITGFDNKAMLSTKGYGNVYCIELAQQNAVGVYKKDGTVIYKFPA